MEDFFHSEDGIWRRICAHGGMQNAKLTETFSGAVSGRGTFLNLTKLLKAYWHRNVNTNCLAWCFLVIAMPTRDPFLCKLVALEVGFHSTLASALQCPRVPLNARARTFFHCKEAFPWMLLVIGHGVCGRRVEKLQMNKFPQCAISMLKIAVPLISIFSPILMTSTQQVFTLCVLVSLFMVVTGGYPDAECCRYAAYRRTLLWCSRMQSFLG